MDSNDLLEDKNNFPRILSSELTQRSERLGLSMKELGKAMHLSYDAIYSYERRNERQIPPYVGLLLDFLELKEALRIKRSAETKIDRILL